MTMTLAPDRQPLRFDTLEEVVGALREAGHRVSAASRQVLESLFAADGPVSAEQIAAGGGTTAPLELTSVYRNLERLEQLGVVGHVHVGHGPGLYALTRDGDREYLVCDRCGGVTTLEPGALEPVRAAVRKRFAHHARFSHFPIHGYCDACAQATEPAHGHHHEH